MSDQEDAPQGKTFEWRDHLEVHPAADLFEELPEEELQELAEDLKENGLRQPIVCWGNDPNDPVQLVDGRMRLEGLNRNGLLYETDDHHLGLNTWIGTKWAERSGDRIRFQHVHGGDPYALVLSLNIRRRHLTPEQKRDLIAKLLKAKPELSDRQLRKMAKASKNTAAAVRTELEARGQIDHVEKRSDSKGRKQPANKRVASQLQNSKRQRSRRR
jgi:hypothetical protein